MTTPQQTIDHQFHMDSSHGVGLKHGITESPCGTSKDNLSSALGRLSRPERSVPRWVYPPGTLLSLCLELWLPCSPAKVDKKSMVMVCKRTEDHSGLDLSLDINQFLPMTFTHVSREKRKRCYLCNFKLVFLFFKELIYC